MRGWLAAGGHLIHVGRRPLTDSAEDHYLSIPLNFVEDSGADSNEP
jgi:hypothetical protein